MFKIRKLKGKDPIVYIGFRKINHLPEARALALSRSKDSLKKLSKLRGSELFKEIKDCKASSKLIDVCNKFSGMDSFQLNYNQKLKAFTVIAYKDKVQTTDIVKFEFTEEEIIDITNETTAISFNSGGSAPAENDPVGGQPSEPEVPPSGPTE